MTQKVVLVLSGGLDSATLLYHLLAEGYQVDALSIDYGQRHRDREFASAERICAHLDVPRRQLDLTALVAFFGNNALTGPVPVPEGEYSSETIGTTTVPNRNMILLSVALAWASSMKYEAVAYGAHGG